MPIYYRALNAILWKECYEVISNTSSVDQFSDSSGMQMGMFSAIRNNRYGYTSNFAQLFIESWRKRKSVDVVRGRKCKIRLNLTK
jgi:hypothetical protein